jgi:hypothetical protein
VGLGTSDARGRDIRGQGQGVGVNSKERHWPQRCGIVANMIADDVATPIMAEGAHTDRAPATMAF